MPKEIVTCSSAPQPTSGDVDDLIFAEIEYLVSQR